MGEIPESKLHIVKPLKLGILHRVFEDAGRYYLSVAATGFFPFAPEPRQILRPDTEMWQALSEELPEGTVFDMTMPKPRGEALVYGRAFAAGGEPVRALDVSLSIGPVAKALRIYGDRFWRGREGRTDPEPFSEMPLDWSRAFGGEGFEPNPLGKGFVPAAVEGGGSVEPLPNIEDPARLIRSRDDRPAPAGFAPYDLTWPQRMKLAGTYDETWYRERFPSYALDMDWEYFNTAPPDQRREGFWTGDEPFALRGMHPDRPVVEGRLPAVRARCFLNQKTSAGVVFKEIGLRLETLWFLPHRLAGILAWRGVTEVAEDDATDVAQIQLAYERLADAPRSLEYYRDTLEVRTDPDKRAMAFLRETDLMPPGERSFVDELTDTETGEAARYAGEGVRAERGRVKAQTEIDAMRQRMTDVGLDPDALGVPAEAPEPEVLDTENLDMAALIEKMKTEAETRQKEGEEKLRELCQAAGVDFDEAIAQARAEAKKPMRLDVESQIASMREAGIDRPDLEEKLRSAAEAARKTRPLAAHFAPKPGPITAEETAACRDEILRRMAADRDLSGMDGAGADLSGMDLSGANLAGALFEGASFAGANLSGADLSGAALAHCDFSGADLSGVHGTETNLGASVFAGATLEGADLPGAILVRADLSDGRFGSANFAEAQFYQAGARGADFSGANLSKAYLIELDATGAVFAEARLAEATWISARADGADFRRASAPEMNFLMTDAPGADFEGADMAGFRNAGANDLSRVRFVRANLDRAFFGDLDLSGADFTEATFRGGFLLRCRCGGATLRNVSAAGAQFLKADLEGADLSRIDLMDGSLRGARLVNATLEGANLHGTDMLKAVFGETVLAGTLRTQTILRDVEPE